MSGKHDLERYCACLIPFDCVILVLCIVGFSLPFPFSSLIWLQCSSLAGPLGTYGMLVFCPLALCLCDRLRSSSRSRSLISGFGWQSGLVVHHALCFFSLAIAHIILRPALSAFGSRGAVDIASNASMSCCHPVTLFALCRHTPESSLPASHGFVHSGDSKPFGGDCWLLEIATCLIVTVGSSVSGAKTWSCWQ